MDGKPTLGKICETIEKFDVRKLFDPHHKASYENVEELYQTILECIRQQKESEPDGNQ